MGVLYTHRKFVTCSTGARICLVFVILSVLLLTVNYQPDPTDANDPKAEIYHCYMDELEDEEFANKEVQSLILKNVLNSDVKPIPGKTIFFFETKCDCSNREYKVIDFAAHQACSIESAALHNPNFEVFVLFACPTIRPISDTIIDAILSYKNVKFRYVNLREFSRGTPIEDWLKGYSLFDSRYLMFTISDLFRLLALYNYGGIYLDMDVVVLKSFENEPQNFMGAETTKSIGNSVIGLAADGLGHEVAGQILTDFYQNYNGNVWAHNGPMSLVRVMSSVCGTSDIHAMEKDQKRCQGIKLYSRNAFYEINWLERKHFFNAEFKNKTLHRLRSSIATHTWNHVKTDWPFKTNSKSAYIEFTSKSCPRVFKATGKYFT